MLHSYYEIEIEYQVQDTRYEIRELEIEIDLETLCSDALIP